MNKQDFIEEIAKAVIEIAPAYGINVVSPIVAQACLESAYGTENKAKYHNYFGLKFRAGRLNCHNGTFIDTSKEQNSDGTYSADEVGTYYLIYKVKNLKYGTIFKVQKIRLITFVEESEGTTNEGGSND